MVEKGFLPHPPPEAVQESETVSPHEDPRAADLSTLPWSSIDNRESKDLDQLEVVEKTSTGYRILVAIADVARFVAKEGAVDRFAAHNGTSVYTGVRTFPMIPEALSYDLTSLLPEKRRSVLVIESSVADDGRVTGGKVYTARVLSRAKLDYPTVSRWLEGEGAVPDPLDKEPTLRSQVELQARVAQLLGEARRREGALDVDSGEARVETDSDGQVVGIITRQQDLAGRLISELMIASNKTVAHVLDNGGACSIRRVVKAPERWARIVVYAREQGAALPETPDSRALAGFVDQMRQTRAEQFPEIALALLKLMGRGEYAAHRPGDVEVGHFGLATASYTHSTAPNRRYCDLVVQRLLGALLSGEGSPYTYEQLAEIATHVSERESAAQKVSRRVQKSAAASLLSSRLQETFQGIVTGASPKGTYVRIFHPDVEGKIVEGSAGLDVGEHVKVRLKNLSVEKGFIDFETV